MKKSVMCIALAAILLVMAIPAFAAGTFYTNSYSASKVLHYFTTSRSIVKSDAEAWLKVQDIVTYSYYCNNDTGAVTDTMGYHTTYLANSNGKVLSGPITGHGACTITFSSVNDITAIKNCNTIRLRISNPEDGSSDNVYLKTVGNFQGEVKAGVEIDTVTLDLDAE